MDSKKNEKCEECKLHYENLHLKFMWLNLQLFYITQQGINAKFISEIDEHPRYRAIRRLGLF